MGSNVELLGASVVRRNMSNTPIRNNLQGFVRRIDLRLEHSNLKIPFIHLPQIPQRIIKIAQITERRRKPPPSQLIRLGSISGLDFESNIQGKPRFVRGIDKNPFKVGNVGRGVSEYHVVDGLN